MSAVEPIGSRAPSSALPPGVALRVENLRVLFGDGASPVVGLDDVSLTVHDNELLALVGESGSGKSVLLQTLLGLHRGSPGLVRGAVHLALDEGALSPYEGIEEVIRRGRDGRWRVPARWRRRVEARFRGIRGRGMGLVLQNGIAALNPYKTIRWQLEHVQRLTGARGGGPAVDRMGEARGILADLGFTDPQRVLDSYPHELSGGMAQRAMIAIVLSLRPRIVLLDEVTTGLDVSLQAEITNLLRSYNRTHGMTGIVVTHDLGIAERLADRIMVMRGGRVLEEFGTGTLDLLSGGHHPYTLDLFRAAEWSEDAVLAESRPEATTALDLRGVTKSYQRRGRQRGERTVAVRRADIRIQAGECVALVGESGSGKTTLARLTIGLTRPTAGEVVLLGRDLGSLDLRAEKEVRKWTQILFQNPYTSLNPEMSVVGAVAEGLVIHEGLKPREADVQARALLTEAGLGHRLDAVLGSLSGGERRRVGLVRALSCGGRVIVLDEPSTGLDAVYRSMLARMIERARAEDPSRTFVFVSHDLGFVSAVAERVIVMLQGKIVEECTGASLLDPAEPHHPYTEALLAAAKYVRVGSDIDEPLETRPHDPRPSNRGCAYAGRCRVAQALGEGATRCVDEDPALRGFPRGRIACHEVKLEI